METSKIVCLSCNLAWTAGLESAVQLHLGETHAEGLQEEKRVVAAMETTQTQRPGTVRQHSQQQGLTAISFEEKKILLSLDRLNHQLHCEHFVKAVCIGLPMD